jgi:hypothetical protein
MFKRGSSALLIGALCLSISLSGCSVYNDASNSVQVIGNIISLAQTDLPSLVASGVIGAGEEVTVQQWLAGLSTLDTQTANCVQSAHVAGNAKAGFLACFNIFANGIVSPEELALLRILSPKAQQQVQLWATALSLAVNAIIQIAGGTAVAAPVVAQVPASPRDLALLRERLHLDQYGL